MEKTIRVGLLYEYYHSLLTARQQEIVELYYYDDLSLNEIGDNLNISKQAVSDQLSKATKKMEDLEGNLNILARTEATLKVIREVEDKLATVEDENVVESRELLKNYASVWLLEDSEDFDR